MSAEITSLISDNYGSQRSIQPPTENAPLKVKKIKPLRTNFCIRYGGINVMEKIVLCMIK